MKLLALRLANFRRFSQGVALENLATGVNVIPGPNESGKSTFFQALEAAFLVRHNVTGAGLEVMRPRGGGEPVVEVDFETRGRRWRIRKQFGRGRQAVLSDLATTCVEARAAEAEEALLSFVGAGSDGPGRAGLVWVRQQRTLRTPDPDLDPETGKARGRGEGGALLSLIGEEVLGATGSRAEAVIANVEAALLEFVTFGRGEPKKNGAYDLALRARDGAKASLETARRAEESSEARLKTIAELSNRAGALAARDESENAEKRIIAMEAQIAQARQIQIRRDVLRAELAAAESEAQLARQALASARGAEERRAELCETLHEARALEETIRKTAGDLDAARVTPAELQRLEDLAYAIAMAKAELGPPGAAVDVALMAEGAGKITINGVAVDDAARLPVTEMLVLDITGIGSLTITTAGAARARAARQRAEAAGRELAQSLAALGAASLESARTMAAARQAQADGLIADRARLQGVAPGGSRAIETVLAALPPPIDADGTAALKEKFEACERALLMARQGFAAADAAALNETAFRELLAEREAAKRQAAARAEELRRLEIEVERLKGEQAGFDEDGRAGETQRAEGLLQRAEAEVARLEAEVAALRLLRATLQRAAAGARARYIEPVARAVVPYLARLFPGSALDFSRGFTLEALSRAGEREEFATLSDGTREQLAVLVRMGFARLLAERGASVPLVLDDPLVYSDDVRTAAMSGALVEAARLHQVVLFTCREGTFASLPGARLAITPWTPSTTDA